MVTVHPCARATMIAAEMGSVCQRTRARSATIAAPTTRIAVTVTPASVRAAACSAAPSMGRERQRQERLAKRMRSAARESTVSLTRPGFPMGSAPNRAARAMIATLARAASQRPSLTTRPRSGSAPPRVPRIASAVMDMDALSAERVGRWPAGQVRSGTRVHRGPIVPEAA